MALRPHAALAGKAAMPATALQPWSLPAQLPDTEHAIAQALIGAAVLAPSHWNTQPWRFEVDGALIRTVADPHRSLPTLDRDRCAMRIALGAALENMLVAARAWGLRTSVTYGRPGDENEMAAQLAWTAGGPGRDPTMLQALTARRTHRGDFDQLGLYDEHRAALEATVPADFRIHWLEERETIEAIGEIAHDATHEQVSDPRIEAERYAWMRFDDQDRERGDGLSLDAMDLGGPPRWFAHRFFEPRSRLLGQGARSLAHQALGRVRSAGALALLTMPALRDEAWLLGGQVYERLALKATQLGIAHQPIHAPIEQARHRAQLLRWFGATGEEPLVFLRLGHAKPPPATTRRGVAVVSSFRRA
jgi:nitroreductase